MRLNVLAMLTAMMTCLTGCLTMAATDHATSPRKTLEWPEITDTIVAVGQADQESLKKIGQPEAVAFIGLKHTYLLFEGGDTLLRLSQELNGNNITISPEAMRMLEDHSIVGYSDPHRMFVKDQTIWGSLTVTYRPSGVLSQEEQAALERLDFKKPGYTKTIKFKGVLAPRLKIPENLQARLRVKRSISFYAPSGSDVIPAIGRYSLIPLAIAADVVTLPVQVIGLTVILLTWEGPFQ